MKAKARILDALFWALAIFIGLFIVDFFDGGSFRIQYPIIGGICMFIVRYLLHKKQ